MVSGCCLCASKHYPQMARFWAVLEHCVCSNSCRQWDSVIASFTCCTYVPACTVFEWWVSGLYWGAVCPSPLGMKLVLRTWAVCMCFQSISYSSQLLLSIPIGQGMYVTHELQPASQPVYHPPDQTANQLTVQAPVTPNPTLAAWSGAASSLWKHSLQLYPIWADVQVPEHLLLSKKRCTFSASSFEITWACRNHKAFAGTVSWLWRHPGNLHSLLL